MEVVMSYINIELTENQWLEILHCINFWIKSSKTVDEESYRQEIYDLIVKEYRLQLVL